MGKFVDLTGNRYGKLVVVSRAEGKKEKTEEKELCGIAYVIVETMLL